MFLEECKFAVNKKKMPEHITDDIEISSDSDRADSGEKKSNIQDSGEENLDEEN